MNSVASFLDRNAKPHNSPTKTHAHVTLVRRPHLEYCSTAGVLFTIGGQKKVEDRQRKPARRVTGNYSNAYSLTATVVYPRGESLESRRSKSQLIMFHRINNLSDVPPAATLSPPEWLLHVIGSDESHFNFSLLGRAKVTRQRPQNHNLFEEKGEPKQNRASCLPA